MSPTLRRAALRRLIFRAMMSAALLVVGISVLLPSAWLGPEPMLVRAAFIGTGTGVGVIAALLAVATRKRPRVTGPRSEPSVQFVSDH